MALRFSPTTGAGAASLSSFVRGPQGSAATIAVGTTTTNNGGTTATVSNSGSSSAATFNFGIPRAIDSGMRYSFESSTTMAAPASGGIRLNNAALASVTQIAVNASNSDAVDVSDFVAAWDDSTSSLKGYLTIRKEGPAAVFGLYQITSVTDNSTWLQIAVTYIIGSGSPVAQDVLYLISSRTGDAGTVTSNDSNTSIDGEGVLFSGTSGNIIKRLAITGVLKATAGVLATATANTDYLTPPATSLVLKGGGGGALATATAGTDYMKPDTTSALTKGFTSASVDAGTKSSGTYTFDPTAGGVQHCTNGGAFTLAPSATHGSWMLDIVNNGSAGTITTSGWTKVDGDPLDTTNTHAFRCYLSVGNQGSHLNVKRMV